MSKEKSQTEVKSTSDDPFGDFDQKMDLNKGGDDFGFEDVPKKQQPQQEDPFGFDDGPHQEVIVETKIEEVKNDPFGFDDGSQKQPEGGLLDVMDNQPQPASFDPLDSQFVQSQPQQQPNGLDSNLVFDNPPVAQPLASDPFAQNQAHLAAASNPVTEQPKEEPVIEDVSEEPKDELENKEKKLVNLDNLKLGESKKDQNIDFDIKGPPNPQQNLVGGTIIPGQGPAPFASQPAGGNGDPFASAMPPTQPPMGGFPAANQPGGFAAPTPQPVQTQPGGFPASANNFPNVGGNGMGEFPSMFNNNQSSGFDGFDTSGFGQSNPAPAQTAPVQNNKPSDDDWF